MMIAMVATSWLMVTVFSSSLAVTPDILPLPKNYADTSLVSQLSFNYGNSSNAPTTSDWIFSSNAVNSSSGLYLNSSSTSPKQAYIQSKAHTTDPALRIETKLSFSYNSSTCSKIGLLVTKGDPIIETNDTLSNFQGVALWLDVCSNGSFRSLYSSTAVSNYNPADSNLASCGFCSLKSVPSSGNLHLVVQLVKDRMTVGMKLDRSYKVCLENVPVTGYETLANASPLIVSVVSLNNYHAEMKVAMLNYYKLNFVTTASYHGFQTEYLMPSSSTLEFDRDLSFYNYSDFQYTLAQNASAGPAMNVAKLVPNIQATEGSLISSKNVAIGTSNFRAEISFSLSSFATSDPPSFLYFILADRSLLPMSAESLELTTLINQFRGILFRLHITNSRALTMTSLFVSNNLTNNFSLTAPNLIPPCTSGLDYMAQELLNGTDQLAIQLLDDQLTITLAPLGTYQTPFYLYSNQAVEGFGRVLAETIINPTLQIMQRNGANNASIVISNIQFFSDAPSLKSSTTTSKTLMESKIETLLSYVSDITSFPIPELVPGNPVPLISVAEMLKCTYIQPTVRAPNDVNPTDIYLTLSIDRLLDIRDIDEAISISATMYMQWKVPTCPASTAAVEDIERVLVAQPEQVWHPTIIYANSSDDVYMQSTQYGADMQILYLPTTPNRTLFFYWTQLGIFTSKCELDLRKFPFDEQTCDFTFLMKEPHEFVKFAGIYLREPIMSPNGQWNLVHTNGTFSTTPSTIVRNGMSSYALFELKFSRNPSYHIYNLLAPCFVLIALVIASFLMPPEKPDRPVICCTILLAFVVAQSDVLKEVPHTSQRILLAEYILFFTGLTGVVTMYDMMACGFCHAKDLANKQITILCGKTKMRAVRAFDIAAFLLAFDFLVIINFYAAAIIMI